MTLQEENEALKAKLKELEEFLTKAMEGPYHSGSIISKQVAGMFRIVGDAGDEQIIAAHPEIIDKGPKEGTRILFNSRMVVSLLPLELEKTPEEVQFDFIEWEQIGGIKSQVERIKEIINAPTMYGSHYKDYGLQPSKGVLLYGPPGCGKTMIAKAIASNFLRGHDITRDSFIYMKGGEMLSPYVGVAEGNIKAAFTRARKNFKEKGHRSVIFIDEAEAILPTRGSRRSTDVESTIVPTFLSEMDGFEDSGCFVILATNHPNQIDPAVIRPGRIDLKVEIGRPDMEDSKEIFGIYLAKTKCNSENLAEVAATHLFNSPKAALASGALIKNIVDRASLAAVRRAMSGTDDGVTEADIIEALREV